jgi:1-acyl-sn-glycerol-3-phosphate acyltransferase
MANYPRALARALRLLGHALSGIATVLWRFPSLSAAQRHQRVQAWAAALLVKAGIRLEVVGQPVSQGPALLVANHISWLDIPVMHAARFCRFISKDDVRSWPLIGRLASAADTLYISRTSRRDAQRMVQTMADSLQQGDVLAVFPEGTTSDGLGLLPFHSNLLQAAVQADVAVQPVALRFVAADGSTSTAPSYVGDTALLTSIWRTLCADQLVARLHYGPPQKSQGRDRRVWAQDLHAEVNRLRLPVSMSLSSTPALRQAAQTDAQALRAILWATYETTWKPEVTAAKHAQICEQDKPAAYVQSRGDLFWLAECDGVVAAMVDWEDDFVHALHVLPSFQGRGLGQALLQHAEAAMRAAGHAKARLETDTFNQAAIGFYERHGYQCEATYPDEEWESGLTTVLMTKAL